MVEDRIEPLTGDARREFLRRAGLLGMSVAAGAAAVMCARPRPEEAPALRAGAEPEPEPVNDTTRMQADLRRALSKPVEKRRWAMVIDTRRCIGCHACTVACIAENDLPPGVTYRVVPEAAYDSFPRPRRVFMPTNCMQCERPPCVEATNQLAPGAMARRPDGIVTLDHRRCRGPEVFRAARKACPYTALYLDPGTRYSDGTPRTYPFEGREVLDHGRPVTRADTAGAVRKCHFCLHRIERGALPACVATCTGQAMHFGDLNDPASLVSRILGRSKSMRFEEAKGTAPRVWYVTGDPEKDCLSCHG